MNIAAVFSNRLSSIFAGQFPIGYRENVLTDTLPTAIANGTKTSWGFVDPKLTKPRRLVKTDGMLLNPEIIFQPNDEMITPEELRAFEQKIGYTLPSDYTQFMLEYNGADFTPASPKGNPDYASLIFHIPDFEGKPYDMDIKVFKSLSKDIRKYDMYEVYKTMIESWEVPKNLLPFALTAGNLKIMLCLDGTRRGHVLIGGQTYVDKYENQQPISSDDFISLAPTFSDFMRALAWKYND